MILGTSNAAADSAPNGFESRTRGLTGTASGRSTPQAWLRPWGASSVDRASGFAADEDSGSWVAVSGNPLFGFGDANREPNAQTLLRELQAQGIGALRKVDGGFAIAWWDARNRVLTLVRDRFGIEPIYYCQKHDALWFASRIRDLVAAQAVRPEVCPEGLAQFLVFCYVPGVHTLHKSVLRVPPGHYLEFREGRDPAIERWYSLSFADPWKDDEQTIAMRYRGELEKAVQRRVYGNHPGVFLSGGMDSSSVATFIRRNWDGQIDTFGFRCGGTSFDESYYARALAEELQTSHHEVDFDEEASRSVVAAIEHMEVPFCDVGIEVGTWLLGGLAQGKTEYLLTGDGGDEMWASHPVYAAQKVMRYYDRLPIPQFVHRGLWRFASSLPDSDKKRNLPVILKRILPMPGVSADLRHFRWRMYYAAMQLGDVVSAPWSGILSETDPLRFVRDSFDGYQGPDDGISAMLYSDYSTVSEFYFSRLMLCRHFGLEIRMPFYDVDFVEFGARIPAKLKLEGLERTKRLFRVAMEGVLPNVINDRKDKLGHSVPLKNWLRNRALLYDELGQTLTRKVIENRGLFRYDAVERMLAEHESRRHNHSHRIWAMFVLEKWLQVHMP